MRGTRAIVSVAMFCAGLSACGGHPEDGFRARIPTGCTTEDSCSALEQEAQRRYVACTEHPPVVQMVGGERSCGDEMADHAEVARRHHELRQAAEANHLAAIQKTQDGYASASREAVRLQDVRRTLDGSCEDQKRIDAALALTPSDVPTQSRASYEQGLRDDAAKKRATRIVDAARTVQYDSRRSVKLVDLENPDDGMRLVETARGALAALRCEGQPSDDLAAVQAAFDEWSAAIAKQVSDEKACRASTECTASRLAAPICETIENRKGFVLTMARERANPSGYVNKVLLHDMGEAIQNADAQLVELKQEFRATTKQTFSEARCRASR